MKKKHPVYLYARFIVPCHFFLYLESETFRIVIRVMLETVPSTPLKCTPSFVSIHNSDMHTAHP